MKVALPVRPRSAVAFWAHFQSLRVERKGKVGPVEDAVFGHEARRVVERISE